MQIPDDTPVFHFKGFINPNTTPVPDVVFDELLAVLTGSELKVLLYIIRRTFGFKKDKDDISLSQMMKGITTRAGKILDKGCGIKDKGTLLTTLSSLIDKNIIIAIRNTSQDKGNEPTTYALNMVSLEEQKHEAIDEGNFPPPLDGKSHLGVDRKKQPSPRVENPTTQETVLQETDLQFRNSNRSSSKILNFKKGENNNSISHKPEIVRKSNNKPNNSNNSGFSSIESILQFRNTPIASVSPEDKEIIQSYISDFAREFNDSAPLKSSITRAVNLYSKSGLNRGQFIGKMYEARSLTNERTPSINNKGIRNSNGYQPKEKMAYFFAVLTDKLHLK